MGPLFYFQKFPAFFQSLAEHKKIVDICTQDHVLDDNSLGLMKTQRLLNSCSMLAHRLLIPLS